MKPLATLITAYGIFMHVTGFHLTYKKIISPKWQTMKSIGISMILVGMAMVAISAYYIATGKRTIEKDSVEVNKENKPLNKWLPVTGIILLAGGIVLVVADRKKIKT